MLEFLRRPLSLALAVSMALPLLGERAFAQSYRDRVLPGEYNPGPNRRTEMGRELIDIFADQPEYFAISEALTEEQKFRYIFGLMMTRTYFDPNAVKIFFIGQDATHIAEAAKQPGTSGFGARVQSLGNHFGVDQGVATSNAFLSTIKGQYGAFDHIYVEEERNGQLVIRQSSYVDNELFALANNPESEIVKGRERFWEWMIKNNPESLQLMILFGGAARDAFAEFLIKRGAEVPPKMNPERLRRIQVPETKLVYAGGNNEFPVPIDQNGQDIYQILVAEKFAGRELDYSKPEDQELAIKTLKEAGRRGIDMMIFTGGGMYGSGAVNPAQFGGYDLEKVKINGKETVSLKGLRLSDGSIVQQDIAFAVSAHPTVLSMQTPERASQMVEQSLAPLRKLQAESGWRVRHDEGWSNRWHERKPYEYGRADIRPGYFEYGAPNGRRVSRADASRLDPQVIVAGSRNRPRYDRAAVDAVKRSRPSDPKDPNDLFANRPRQTDTRAQFDEGPGREFGAIWDALLDLDKIGAPKPEMEVRDSRGRDITFETHGVDAYNIKSAPDEGRFGPYRGSFDNSEVLILADPHGVDDWNTGYALTGARGQFLNGLMRDIGVGEKYFVLKTVPFVMDGATPQEWETVRSQTEQWRELAIKRVLEAKDESGQRKIKSIFTDGPVAEAEMRRILAKLEVTGVTVIDIRRDSADPSIGIVEAGAMAKRLGVAAADVEISGKMADIPRSHLSWWSRSWEGTGGDTTLNTLGKSRGKVFLVIAPDWVARQRVRLLPATRASIDKLTNYLRDQGTRVKESVQDFMRRVGLTRTGWNSTQGLRARFNADASTPVATPISGQMAPSSLQGGAATCSLIFGGTRH